jgi:Glycosyl hydrolase family 67 N-terminus
MNRRRFLKAGMAVAGQETFSRLLCLRAVKGPSSPFETQTLRHKSAEDSEFIDLIRAVIVSPQHASRRERKAVQVLVEEIERRTEIHLPVASAWPANLTATIVVGTTETLQRFDSQLAQGGIRGKSLAMEGYCLRALPGLQSPRVIVAGSDERGVLFGVGGLLRSLHMTRGSIKCRANLDLATSPRYPLRGHQLGYRPKTNSYDGWSVALWDQYIRDLAVFGTNAIELIPSRSDDVSDSPLFTLPPAQMMVEMSRIADEYGLDVWIWYPAMDKDYSDPKTVEAALAEWGKTFKRLPRINAVFVPGGDPGHTEPKYLLAFLEKQTHNLHRYHPGATTWVSPQSFDEQWLEEFYRILRRDRPRWLGGVVFGPQVRDDLPTVRKRVPERYPIRFYPDITHSLECQFPVPDWDTAYALTEGREVINPRPEGYTNIMRKYLPYTIGHLCYSEGCNDDVNKIVASAIAWDPQAEVADVLREYSRYFIGEDFIESYTQGLLALEKNWQGPLLSNGNVDTTLEKFRAMENSASPPILLKWRFQQGLYRAYYDCYTRRRLIYETDLEKQALSKLQEIRGPGLRSIAGNDGSSAKRQATHKTDPLALMSEAEVILDRALADPAWQNLRTQILELGEALFQSIRMQLSVERYGAESISRGANLDTLDTPLTSAPWLKKQFADIRQLDSAISQMKAIEQVLERTNPGLGGFYDDLGDLSQQPHLLRGLGGTADPEFRTSALVGFDYPDTFKDEAPIAWKRWAGSLFDAPLRMYYSGLDPNAGYKIRVVYSGDEPRIKIRLECNGDYEVHPYIDKPWPPRPLEFDIPHAATSNGELTLAWTRPSGLGHNGRGCQVAEVWLIKK